MACQLPFAQTPSMLDGQNADGNEPASLTVAAPQQIAAGTPLTVTVRNPVAVVDSDAVQLYLYNTNGTRLFTAIFEDGRATIAIAAADTEVAGEVTLFAQNGTRTGHATLSIVPGPPIEPVLLLVGPRSVTADGDHWTMVTALPHDHFGNAVAEGTTVTVRALHPASTAAQLAGNPTLDDEIEVLSTETNYLLAWERVFARTVAGRMDIAVTAGAAHSPERTVLAVPGPPRSFALRSEPLQRTADGRRLATIYTEPLQDRFGNQLLDGTAVTFRVTDSDGTTRSLPTQSIDGKASIQLQSPTIPGVLEIVALVLNTTSEPFSLDFTAGLGIGTIEVRAIPTDDVLTLIAGPLLGPLEQYIPDGSDVDFLLTPVNEEGNAGQAATIQVTAQAAAGFATTVIRNSLLTASRYEVIVRAGIGEGRTSVILGSE